MGVVQLRQIRNHLETKFGGFIDLADCQNRLENDRDGILLSRALAAFALNIEADLEAEEAAASVVDGFDDNGIDAIYYSSADKTLFICQAKWSHDGNSLIDQGAAEKFVKGVQDLLNLRFDRFNNRVEKRKSELDAAINSASRIALIIAVSASGRIGDHPKRSLDDYLAELNDTGEVASLALLTQDRLYSSVSQGGRSDPVNVDVQLFEWGCTKTPYQAFYGQVAASDLAMWGTKYRGRLYSKNIRAFLGGSTQVNNGVATTIRLNPNNFWYLNNGITALCHSIARRPIGGSTREVGTFECQGVSIVNGAQTVGVLTELASSNASELSQARVAIRLISLQDCPPEFAIEVTKATNTQNRVDLRNFVALDAEQERLRSELLIDGIEYEYRQGEGEPTGSVRFGLVDATVALACAQIDIDLAVQAKREISKLWEELDRAPYKIMFNSGLSGLRLWHCVQLLRLIDGSIETAKSNAELGKRKNLLTHGNRFVAHKVMQGAGVAQGGHMNFKLPTSDQLRGLVDKVADDLENVVEREFSDSYLASLFKNATKCRFLSEDVPVPKLSV